MYISMKEKETSLRPRSDRNETIRQRKRKAAADLIEVEISNRHHADQNEELRAGMRCARLVSQCKITFDEIVDFSILPAVLPFPLPQISEDFDIPNAWKTAKKTPMSSFPRYRVLTKNFYRLPLQRGSCSTEDLPYCSCLSDEGCGIACENKLLFMECVTGDCPSLTREMRGESKEFCGPCDDRNSSYRGSASSCSSTDSNSNSGGSKVLYCSNTSIQRRSYPSSEVFKTGSCGYGLRISENIQIGTIVVEYTGEVITAAECIDRMTDMKGGLMLDAKHMGSVARFANHSCQPTCELQKWNVLGESCIALVATKALLAGSEITYNYQYYEDGLDSLDDKMKRQKCLCGADNCSGTIGGRIRATEGDTWIKRAILLLSSTRKQSIDIFNYHIQLAEKLKINKKCLAEELLVSYGWGMKIEEYVLLEQQLKKVTRIEKAIKNLRGPGSSYSEDKAIAASSASRSDSGSILGRGSATDYQGEDSSIIRNGSSSMDGDRNIKSESSCIIGNSRIGSNSISNNNNYRSSNSSISNNNNDGSINSISNDKNDGSSNSISNGNNDGSSNSISNNNNDKSSNNSNYWDNVKSDGDFLINTSKSGNITYRSATGSPRHELSAEGAVCDVQSSRSYVLPAAHPTGESAKDLSVTKMSSNSPSQLPSLSFFSQCQGANAAFDEGKVGRKESEQSRTNIDSDTFIGIHNPSAYDGNSICANEKNSVLVRQSISASKELDDRHRSNSSSKRVIGDNGDEDSRSSSSGKNDRYNSTSYSSHTYQSNLNSDFSLKLKKVHWSDLMSLFKDVLAVLPLRCIGVDILFSLYNDVNDWTKRYIGGILHHCSFASLYCREPPIFPPALSIPQSVPFHSQPEIALVSVSREFGLRNLSDSHSHSSSISSSISLEVPTSKSPSAVMFPQRASTPILIVQPQIKNLSNGTKKQHMPKDSVMAAVDCVASQYGQPVQTYEAFAAATFLEFRVGLFMERIAAIRDANIVLQPIDIRGTAISSSLSSSSAPSLMYCTEIDPTDTLCFCRMSAAMGETPVQSQCDSCDRWYHPNCVNAALVSHSASRSSDSFLCPLCLHIQGRPSSFAFKPISEWKIIKNAGSGSLSRKARNNHKKDDGPLINSSAARGGKNNKKGKNAESLMLELIGKDRCEEITKRVPGERKGKVEIEKKTKGNGAYGESNGAIRMDLATVKGAPGADLIGKVAVCNALAEKKGTAECGDGANSLRIGDDKVDITYGCSAINEFGELDGVRENSLKLSKVSDSLQMAVTEGIIGSSEATIMDDVESLGLTSGQILDRSKDPLTSDSPVYLRATALSPVDSLVVLGKMDNANSARPVILSAACTVANANGRTSSMKKGKKAASTRSTSDPLVMEDLREAMKAERALMVSQSPAALLLGLCRIHIEAWREKATAFLSRDEIHSLIFEHPQRDPRYEIVKDSQYQSQYFHRCVTCAPPDTVGPGSSAEGRFHRKLDTKSREAEAILLKECLHLYFEPRLIRIQPPESLELRAVAYLISASMALQKGGSCVPIGHHSTVKSEALSHDLDLKADCAQVCATSISGSDENSHNAERRKIPDSNNVPCTSRNLITLRELQMIIEGGQYFSKLQFSGCGDNAVKKKRAESKVRTSVTQVIASRVSQPSDDSQFKFKEFGSICEKDHRPEATACFEKEMDSERVKVKRRQALWASVQRVVGLVTSRLNKCLSVLQMASRCSLLYSFPAVDVNINAMVTMEDGSTSSGTTEKMLDSRYGPGSTLAICTIMTQDSAVIVPSETCTSGRNGFHLDMGIQAESFSEGISLQESSLNELLRVDALLKKVGEGISIEGEYSYVRLKSLIFAGMRDIRTGLESGSELQPSGYEGDGDRDGDLLHGVAGDEDGGHPLEVVDQITASPEIMIKLYCWCNGKDDGTPMVQCDGCDEWFHSNCMGITRQSSSEPLPYRKISVKQKKVTCSIAMANPPSPTIHSTEDVKNLDHDPLVNNERESVELNGKSQAALKAKGKSKGRGKGKSKGLTSTRELEEAIDDVFFCISCSEQNGHRYAFEWLSEFGSSSLRVTLPSSPFFLCDIPE